MLGRKLISFGVLAAFAFILGCSGTGRLRYETPQEAFEQGKSLFEREKYQRAVDYFQAVFDFGRTSDVAADAQLYLARSYYHNGEYILAANEYTRFVDIYRNDPRSEDAEFERALSYFQLSPSYELDQTNTRQAITFLQLFLDRYPSSDKKDDAESRIAGLREKLAHKDFAAAELYERREMYEAAALTYENVFDNYSDTEWADDALLGAMRSYIAFSELSIRTRQAERLQAAIDHYERLVQLFRDSPLVKDAESLYEQAAGRLAQLTSAS